MSGQLNRYGITRKMILRALRKAKKVLDYISEYVDLSEKVRSEIISGVLEQELAKSLTQKLGFPVKPPTSDMEPDLTYTKYPDGENSVEIKVAAMPNGKGSWRGGLFSKRSAPHLLVARDNEFSHVYVVLLQMNPSDWVQPKGAGTDEQNYYAHTVSKKELIKRNDRIEFLGDIERVMKNDGTRSIRIKMNMDSIRKKLFGWLKLLVKKGNQKDIYFEEE